MEVMTASLKLGLTPLGFRKRLKKIKTSKSVKQLFFTKSQNSFQNWSQKSFFSFRSNCRSNRSEVFCKKVFLEISKNLQGNTCARVFFNKVANKGSLVAASEIEVSSIHWAFKQTWFFIRSFFSKTGRLFRVGN